MLSKAQPRVSNNASQACCDDELNDIAAVLELIHPDDLRTIMFLCTLSFSIALKPLQHASARSAQKKTAEALQLLAL